MVGTAVSAIGIGASLLGSKKQAKASKQAAATQAAGADRASDVELDMYNQTREDQAPWLKSGTAALNNLNWLMGITPKAGTPYPVEEGATPDKYNFTGGADGGPYNPEEGINKNLGGYGSLSKSFGLSDFYEDPSYQFSLDQGKKSIQASAAAGGGLYSGATMKALSTYGQNTAASQYQTAYDRYNQNQSTLFNRLSGIAGTGQQSANTLGSIGQNTANQIGNNITSGAAADAAGTMGAANAWSTGLQNFGNTAQDMYDNRERNLNGTYNARNIIWN